ncbi:hypothetical protein BZG36_04275 [Bifiguratus adelaidae]|uniref:MHD domain-containing protein n=1 Tax=Bifiguratus adelaidae TaxID=1938954 RepID=A0A261XWR0_9FUNG|nr:hypothetical protein BZG36_04275 [Bifiguratus adelaidae]
MEGYAKVFLTERPKDGLDLVQGHLRSAQTLTHDLAEYYRERALIEDQYAKSLVKLSKKVFVADPSSLGHFASVWQALLNELNEIATAHGMFGQRVQQEVEQPLRNGANSDPEAEQLRRLEPTMQRLIKDYDDRMAKVTKHKKSTKKDATDKLAEAQKSLNDVRSAWQREGPRILETYQHVERNRLESLKQSVQNFENAQSEQLLKRIEMADATLSLAIAYDVQSEMDRMGSVDQAALSRILTGPDASPAPVRENSSSGGGLKSAFNSFRPSTMRRKSRPDTTVPAKGKKATFNEQMNQFDSNSFYGLNGSTFTATSQPSHPSQPSPSRPDFRQSSIQSFDTKSDDTPKSPSISVPPSSSNPAHPPEPSTPAVDSEGYTIPPPDRSELVTAEQALSDDGDGSVDGGSLYAANKMRVEIKDKAVESTGGEADRKALSRVSTILQSKPAFKATMDRRGRRQTSRATQFFASGVALPVTEDEGEAKPQSPVKEEHEEPEEEVQPIAQPASPGGMTPSSFTSAVSNQSVRPTVDSPPTASENPFGSDSQEIATFTVEADMTETVNVLVTNGEVTKTLIAGEISLAIPHVPATATETLIRLVNNDSLERVVANPAFLKPTDDQPDLYRLNLAAFRGLADQSVVVIKYQPKVSLEQPETFLPLMVKPYFKTSESQTLLLVKYALDPTVLYIDGNFTLDALSVSVPLQYVTDVQSQPEAQWDSTQETLTWTLTEVPHGEQRLMAKLATSAEAATSTLRSSFTLSNCSISQISLEAERAEFHVKRVLKSGKYLAA